MLFSFGHGGLVIFAALIFGVSGGVSGCLASVAALASSRKRSSTRSRLKCSTRAIAIPSPVQRRVEGSHCRDESSGSRVRRDAGPGLRDWPGFSRS